MRREGGRGEEARLEGRAEGVRVGRVPRELLILEGERNLLKKKKKKAMLTAFSLEEKL